ncbi:uncharacterized protein [Tenebrio molitor]|uniref:uncharacterized protein n=1 Tax=Tenebrio molitor TaxID=7067 RepID=UPI0036247BDB
MSNLKITKTICYKDSDDPFVLIRKLFLDFGYNKVIKCANLFYIIFYSFIACLEIYFMIDNFSVELIARYGPPLVVLIYSGRVFDTLTQCSWYNWDARNKQILLIFMANSIKPSTLVFAGIVVDYKLAVSIFRSACSYALVLYNLRKLR